MAQACQRLAEAGPKTRKTTANKSGKALRAGGAAFLTYVKGGALRGIWHALRSRVFALNIASKLDRRRASNELTRVMLLRSYKHLEISLALLQVLVPQVWYPQPLEAERTHNVEDGVTAAKSR